MLTPRWSLSTRTEGRRSPGAQRPLADETREILGELLVQMAGGGRHRLHLMDRAIGSKHRHSAPSPDEHSAPVPGRLCWSQL